MASKPRNLKTKVKKICEKCLMDNNHPFGLLIQGGLCSGCREKSKSLVSQMKNF